jgi:hypothetical protein
MKREILGVVLGCMLAAGATLLWGGQQEPASPDVAEVTVPEGSEFKLQLHTTINSKTSKAGDRVMATLLDPVALEDRDVLAKGLRIDGHVGEVKSAGHRGKGGFLTISFDTVELPSGEKLALMGSLTEVFSSEGKGSSTVGPEGELKGGGASRKEQIAIIGGAAAAGAAGGLGPGIAAATGGIVAAYILPKGKEAVLASGSLVGMRLDSDMIVTLPAGK